MRDLRGIEIESRPSRANKIVGAIVAIAAFVGLALYAYQQGLLSAPPKQIVTDQELPSPSPPVIPQRT